MPRSNNYHFWTEQFRTVKHFINKHVWTLKNVSYSWTLIIPVWNPKKMSKLGYFLTFQVGHSVWKKCSYVTDSRSNNFKLVQFYTVHVDRECIRYNTLKGKHTIYDVITRLIVRQILCSKAFFINISRKTKYENIIF